MGSLLKLPELRAFAISAACAAFGESALAVVLGLHVYALTHEVLALGWLGLVEGVPAIGLVLIGGQVADRFPRRGVTAGSRAAVCLLALALAASTASVMVLYGVAFVVGGLKAFENPAATGLETEVLPRERMIEAVSLVAAVGPVAGLSGPVVGAALYQWAGPRPTFMMVAALLAVAAVVVRVGIAGRPAPIRVSRGAVADILEGIRFVFRSQVLVGSMALDLFAVFFGGAAGLFPAYADQVLHEGPASVGLLRAAAAVGALGSMLVATRHPPGRNAGRALHLVVAGFGVGVIVLGFSRSLWLSLAALAFVGACDGVSVVIRRAIVRLGAPDALRGRVAAVRGLFLNATNELGAFESGLAGAWLGIAPAIWSGGIVTILVAAATARLAPELLGLDLGKLAGRASRLPR